MACSSELCICVYFYILLVPLDRPSRPAVTVSFSVTCRVQPKPLVPFYFSVLLCGELFLLLFFCCCFSLVTRLGQTKQLWMEGSLTKASMRGLWQGSEKTVSAEDAVGSDDRPVRSGYHLPTGLRHTQEEN